MGAGASVVDGGIKQYVLKQLPEAIEEAVYVEEKFPLLIDPTEQASRFLKYQMGSFIMYDDPQQCTPEYLNRALVGALRYGRTLTLKCKNLADVDRKKLFCNPALFPETVLNRLEFLKPDVWQSVLTNEDPDPSEITISPEFIFIICTNEPNILPELTDVMHPMIITDKLVAVQDGDDGDGGVEGNAMEGVAAMFGGKEFKRNSEQLVEAAFDGDMEEMLSWIGKGYHIESTDGRKHTALSEAACQGHDKVVQYLIEQGADPNSLADNGRSPLWRASFGGHYLTARILLEAGSDPIHRDKVSHESAFDVAQNNEIRELFQNWPIEKTEALKAARKRAVIAKIEERIKTAADREYYARQKIREEIIIKAESGDVDGVKEILFMAASEAEKEDARPRVTAEVRSEEGLSLLAISAKNDDEALATMLLLHWKTCDVDRWDLPEGEISVEAKTFKTNVNSRDMKGWNCACIAVFHKSLKVLGLLLENGANPNAYSMYNKNAFDLAKDELDAAENVVIDKSDIRAVMAEFDNNSAEKSKIFGTAPANAVLVEPRGDTIKVSEGLGENGSPIIMQQEMAKEMATKDNGDKSSVKSKSKEKKTKDLLRRR